MLHACLIKDGKASYCNRYVETSKLKQEQKAGRWAACSGPIVTTWQCFLTSDCLVWCGVVWYLTTTRIALTSCCGPATGPSLSSLLLLPGADFEPLLPGVLPHHSIPCRPATESPPHTQAHLCQVWRPVGPAWPGRHPAAQAQEALALRGWQPGRGHRQHRTDLPCRCASGPGCHVHFALPQAANVSWYPCAELVRCMPGSHQLHNMVM